MEKSAWRKRRKALGRLEKKIGLKKIVKKFCKRSEKKVLTFLLSGVILICVLRNMDLKPVRATEYAPLAQLVEQ